MEDYQKIFFFGGQLEFHVSIECVLEYTPEHILEQKISIISIEVYNQQQFNSHE